MLNQVKTLLLIACCLGLSACATSNFAVEEVREALNYDPAIMERYEINEQWWSIYNDPQLDMLVETALANNPDLAMSAIQVNKALYQANLLGAELVPEFSGDLDASFNRNIKSGDNTEQRFGGTLAVSYEIDLWQRLRDQTSAQEWEYKATMEDMLAARLALINSVIDTYYNLVYLENAMRVTVASINNYRRIHEITSIKYEEGKVASVEPAQARQSLLADETSLLNLESSYKQAQQTMRDLLNMKPENQLDIQPVDLLELVVPEVDINVPLAALANRPDLKAAEYRLRGALDSLSATEKSLYPSITVGAYINSSSERARTMFDVPFTGGSISVNLPFLQWNSIKWQIKISEAEFEDIRLKFEQSINNALNELDYFYFAYGKGRASFDKVREKYQYDLKIADYYQIRYENGASELSDWLNALNTVTSSRLSTLDYRLRLIQLENMIYKAMAGRYLGF